MIPLIGFMIAVAVFVYLFSLYSSPKTSGLMQVMIALAVIVMCSLTFTLFNQSQEAGRQAERLERQTHNIQALTDALRNY